MEDEGEFEKDRERAEVFDALGHPTRIAILKALNEGPVGFAELKKKTGIESSGHLQHHLTKLNGLIKTDAYGKYCLSDQGKDALLTVQTVEQSTPSNGAKTHRRRFNTKTALIAVSVFLAALLVIASVAAVIEFNKASFLQEQNSLFNHFNPFNIIPDNPRNAEIFPAPQVTLLSPESRTYNVTNIPLVFTSNQTDSILIWVAYSLDGQENVTMGNEQMTTTGPMVTNLTNGVHTIVLNVKDNHQLYGKSPPVTFTVAL